MKIEDVMQSVKPGEIGGEGEVPPGMQAATDDEQVSYEKVVLAGMKILYNDATREKVLKAVQSQGDDPAQGMGSVITMIMTQLDEKTGGMIPEEVILPAAAELLEHLGELVDAAKVATVDQTLLGRAAQFMLMGMAQQYDFDPEDVKAVMDSVPDDVIEKIVAEQQGYAAESNKPPAGAAEGAPAPDEQQGKAPAAPAGEEPIEEGDV